jgi:hypothetical protein
MPKCRSCGAEIAWVLTTAGNRMPVNIDRVPNWCPCPGETWVVQVMDGPVQVITVPTDRPLVRLYQPHWATCPDAASWRKTKTSGGS